MIRTPLKFHRALIAAGFAAAIAPCASAQIASLDKGHQLLVNSGLQIWGLNTDSFQYNFNYNNFLAANMNAVMWSHGQSNPGVLTTGQKWGKWVDYLGNPANALNATENAHYADLLSIQVGDEQQTDLENPNGATKAWFTAAHNANLFTDKLLYVNSAYITDTNAYINFLAAANPDAISWDSYPFGTTGVYPYNWLGKAQIFRRVALGSYIGASGTAARPYGLYLQTYHGGDGARDPGDLEMRWQQFTAWTLGYTFVDAFTAGGGNTSLFNSGDGNSPTQPRFDQFKETSRQSRNLGPALVKLISTGYGPNIILGKDPSGTTNTPPIDWPVFNKSNAPPNQQFLSSVTAQNLGTKNGGNPGDVYVGFFNPLLASYGNPAGTAYFMVTNALGAYLQDPTLLVADCTQRITLDFDFGTSTVNSLQRLRRSDGQVEVVPLTYTSGNKFQLQFDLDGGTGDLFKYNDGTPFVGVQTTTLHYWDNDGIASGNNTNTGAGLGGTGNWSTPANKWYNGSGNGAWTANYTAVFMGTAGTVTLSSPQAANSLAFKSTGYTVAGSTLTMNGSFVTTDANVTATINSVVAGGAGLIKNGAGTLDLSGTNTYTGGTTVLGGVLTIASDANLGAVPASSTPGNIMLNGGTLRFAASTDINNNRGIAIGAGGGTIDTQSYSNPSGYNASQGGFRGPGDLTKLGSGTFFAAATTAGANTTWTGRLIIKEGIWKIVASDGLPYNVISADPLKPDQITLDGGTWQIGATFSVTNAKRGVTIAAGGGTIDTQNFDFTWAGPWAGSVTTAVLNKIGSGTLRLNSSATLGPGTYAGIVNVGGGPLNLDGGTLHLDGGTAMGDLAAIDLADKLGVVLNITGGNGETIGSLAGGGLSGGNVTVSTILNTGGNNNSTTFGGVISGVGGFRKSGNGTMRLTGNNTFSGGAFVFGGSLTVDGSFASSLVLQTGATLSGTGSINNMVTIGSGAHLAPGPGIETLDVASLSLSAGALLDFELSTNAGTPISDRVNISGNLAITGGTFNLTNAGGLAVGTYTLLDYSTITGNASNLTLGTTPAGFVYSLVNNTTNTSIDLVVKLPGDFNSDNRVDAADFVVWRKGLATLFTLTDYNTWRANFGRSAASGAASANAVPEPQSWLLLGVGMTMILTARVAHGNPIRDALSVAGACHYLISSSVGSETSPNRFKISSGSSL